VVFIAGWKKYAETEKGAAGQAECESLVDGFFTSSVLCIMNSYVRGANSESLVFARSTEMSRR
jgi:hypothetical protein